MAVQSSGISCSCGHAATLQWLFEHGCPWHPLIMRTAVGSGSVAVMEYLQQQGVVSTAAQLTAMLLYAGENNHLQAAQWLRQQGAAWPARLGYGNKKWHGNVLAWAQAEGCTSPVGN
jgi:hypothetical protein